MKNIYLNVGFLSLIFLFSQCKDQFSIKNKTADASFICTYSSNGTVIANNATITVNDKVIFTSKGTYDNCGRNFALFTGLPGYKYQPNYVMNGSTYEATSSIQTARGSGLLLDTVGGKFVSNATVFLPGTYTVYCVASFVDKKTGDYKQAVDSLVLNVIDPNVSSTVLTSVTLKKTRYGDLKSTSIDTVNKLIIFKDVTDNPTRFTSTQITYISTDLHLFINGVAVSIDTYPFTDGTIVHVVSKDGTKSADYTVKIYYYNSTISEVSSATISQYGSDAPFSGTATISGKTITLPTWPHGTTQCYVNITVDGKVRSIKVTKAQLPLIDTVVSQSKTTSTIYTIVKPALEYSAECTGLAFLTDPSHSHISGSAPTFSVFAVGDSLAKSSLNFSVDPFSRIKYTTSTPIVYSALTTFNNTTSNNTKVDINGKTLYFRIYNGTDSLDVSVKGISY